MSAGKSTPPSVGISEGYTFGDAETTDPRDRGAIRAIQEPQANGNSSAGFYDGINEQEHESGPNSDDNMSPFSHVYPPGPGEVSIRNIYIF